MKKQTEENLSLTSLQLFLACTLLLPFTITLGIVWLCLVYHRNLHKGSMQEEGQLRLTRSPVGSDGVAVLEHSSTLLPAYLSA
jgi:hypothetical protein